VAIIGRLSSGHRWGIFNLFLGMKKRNRWGILRWPQVGYFKVAIRVRTSSKIMSNHVHGNRKWEKLKCLVGSKRDAKLNLTAINLE